ncbi:MAG: hypothetical protein JNJ55_00455 [Betaproteobacteria bacterium]|nr:hypothetical protein [Betaproteobacteria bacterium]
MKALAKELCDIETWRSLETAFAEENKTLLQDRLKRQGEIGAALSDAEWKWFEVQRKLDATEPPNAGPGDPVSVSRTEHGY